MSAEGLRASVEKMRREGIPEPAVATFRHYYEQLDSGASGMVPEDAIEPVRELTDAEALPEGDAPLDEAVVIKLNGGLGTSMGMDRAKSLLEVKDGLTFLDVIARQVLALRESSGARLPLVLMNSFYTRDDSLALLERYDELGSDVPFDFVQHKEPKLLVDGLAPVGLAARPEPRVVPAGPRRHLPRAADLGDARDAARARLPVRVHVELRQPRRRARPADPRLDRGGGAAVRVRGHRPHRGRQQGRPHRCAEGDRRADPARDRADARRRTWTRSPTSSATRTSTSTTSGSTCGALDALLRERDGVIGLPMIVNEKTVDPADSSTPAVYQLETAMGAAIGVFQGARAIRVPRSRFVPVKRTSDLLVLRSDAYVFGEGARIGLAEGRDTAPLVELDDDHFKLLADFDARFPEGPPSLAAAERLTVNGDVTFGRGVVVRGSVCVEGPRRVEDGAELEGR